MSQHKIKFVFRFEEGSDSFGIESLWATEELGNYKIDNIPFFAKNIAFGDVIKAELDTEENALYFEGLITKSGNSVIRIIPFNKAEIDLIGKELVDLGCDWESLKNYNLMSIHIPSHVPYEIIKAYLEDGQERFDYEESCLGFK